jgi:transcriptional regulator GlxA family with amidase domain
MEIAIPVYDRFTALDAIGPYEVLSRIPGTRVRFLGPEAGPVRTDTRMLTIEAEGRWEDAPNPDVLLVPGSTGGTNALLDDERMLSWVRSVHERSTWTTSVCTGSLVLAAAGLLDGLEATSHWTELETLERLGARPTERRVVEQGKIVTAAGVSAGIDMGLVLVGRIAGDDVAKVIQLAIEYDPQPPYDAGSREKAGPELVEFTRAAIAQAAEQVA